MRSTGEPNWEEKIYSVCENFNNTAQEALGGMTPNSINVTNEYLVRNARQKMKSVAPLLDWHVQEDNIRRWKETEGKQKLKPGTYVYMRFIKASLGKSYDW